MFFIFGYITGLLTAILIVATLAYFRRIIERVTETALKQVDLHGPRPKGYIFEAPSEAEQAREKILDYNKAKGKDTPINELL